jgi:hypothetical protein
VSIFVLVHSPAVGPATWHPVADRLRLAGHDVIVPSLMTVADSQPPYWPDVVEHVTAALDGTGGRDPLVLVAHSNAGALVPVIAAAVRQPVECCIFADAMLPAAEGGSTPLAGEQFLPFLASLAGPDGRLPRWTDWWGDADLGPLFPGEASRQAVTAELPRLPLDYFRQTVPVPAGWAGHRCGYVQFSEGYADEAQQASALGWPVRVVRGEHLHQVVDPGAVTGALLDIAGR